MEEERKGEGAAEGETESRDDCVVHSSFSLNIAMLERGNMFYFAIE